MIKFAKINNTWVSNKKDINTKLTQEDWFNADGVWGKVNNNRNGYFEIEGHMDDINVAKTLHLLNYFEEHVEWLVHVSKGVANMAIRNYIKQLLGEKATAFKRSSFELDQDSGFFNLAITLDAKDLACPVDYLTCINNDTFLGRTNLCDSQCITGNITITKDMEVTMFVDVIKAAEVKQAIQNYISRVLNTEELDRSNLRKCMDEFWKGKVYNLRLTDVLSQGNVYKFIEAHQNNEVFNTSLKMLDAKHINISAIDLKKQVVFLRSH